MANSMAIANSLASSMTLASSMAMPSSMVNSLANSLDQAERDLILDALRSGQGNRREAAERLGISQRTLRYKLARLREAGIDVPAA
jgi:two-component system response regulator FlrC